MIGEDDDTTRYDDVCSNHFWKLLRLSEYYGEVRSDR